MNSKKADLAESTYVTQRLVFFITLLFLVICLNCGIGKVVDSWKPRQSCHTLYASLATAHIPEYFEVGCQHLKAAVFTGCAAIDRVATSHAKPMLTKLSERADVFLFRTVKPVVLTACASLDRTMDAAVVALKAGVERVSRSRSPFGDEPAEVEGPSTCDFLRSSYKYLSKPTLSKLRVNLLWYTKRWSLQKAVEEVLLPLLFPSSLTLCSVTDSHVYRGLLLAHASLCFFDGLALLFVLSDLARHSASLRSSLPLLALAAVGAVGSSWVWHVYHYGVGHWLSGLLLRGLAAALTLCLWWHTVASSPQPPRRVAQLLCRAAPSLAVASVVICLYAYAGFWLCVQLGEHAAAKESVAVRRVAEALLAVVAVASPGRPDVVATGLKVKFPRQLFFHLAFALFVAVVAMQLALDVYQSASSSSISQGEESEGGKLRPVEVETPPE